MELILFYITAPLSVALLVFVITRWDHSHNLHAKNQALLGMVEELRERLRQGAEKDQRALSAIREYYDNEVERQKKEIAGLHEERLERLQKLVAQYEALKKDVSPPLDFDWPEEPKK